MLGWLALTCWGLAILLYLIFFRKKKKIDAFDEHNHLFPLEQQIEDAEIAMKKLNGDEKMKSLMDHYAKIYTFMKSLYLSADVPFANQMMELGAKQMIAAQPRLEEEDETKITINVLDEGDQKMSHLLSQYKKNAHLSST